MKVKHKNLITSIKNPRTFVISGNTDKIKPIIILGEIISLVTDTFSIDIGQIFPVKKRNYKVNSIQSKVVGSTITYEVSSAALNKSSLFVFPMLGGERRLFMFEELFINCFIGTEKHKDHIVLLYRFCGDSTFLKFEQALSQFSTFVESYDPSPEYVVFVFRIPENHIQNFKKFKEGKYSELDIIYKTKILEFHNFNLQGDLAQILFKSENRRLRLEEQLNVKLPVAAELHSIINLEEEIFNPYVYINKKRD